MTWLSCSQTRAVHSLAAPCRHVWGSIHASQHCHAGDLLHSPIREAERWRHRSRLMDSLMRGISVLRMTMLKYWIWRRPPCFLQRWSYELKMTWIHSPGDTWLPGTCRRGCLTTATCLMGPRRRISNEQEPPASHNDAIEIQSLSKASQAFDAISS